jgi:ribonuclease HI
MKHVDLIADGSCLSNHGPGGWACILQYKTAERVLTGGSPVATNNQMELRAVTMGLRALREPCAVSVFTDSRYVQDGMSRLISLWKENQWRNSRGRPLAHQRLWQALRTAALRHPISWH